MEWLKQKINNDISSLTFKNIKKEITPYIHKNKELLSKISKEHLDTYTKLLNLKINKYSS